MKPKQLLGLILIVACIITAGLALRGTVRRSLTVQEVRANEGEPCGIYGEVVKGSGVPNKEKVGRVTRAQIKEIAELKMKDLNAINLEGAMKQVEGTARSMGINVVD